ALGLACACVRDEESAAELPNEVELRSVSETPDGTSADKRWVSVAIPHTTSAFTNPAIIAQDNLRVASSAQILSGRIVNIGDNATLIEPDAHVTSILAYGDVTIRTRARASGDILAS